MASEIVINTRLNAASAAKTLKEIKTELKALKSAALEAGEGTAEFKRLTAAAGQLQDQLNDVNETTKALSGNVAENLTHSFAGVAQSGVGAFQAVAGAQALFGEQSESVQKALLKIQALMSLSQGIEGVANMGKAYRDLSAAVADAAVKLGFKTVATEADIVATVAADKATKAQALATSLAAKAAQGGANATQLQTAATRAQTLATGLQDKANLAATKTTKALNTTMLANPAAIIAIAVIALVSALAIYAATTSKISTAEKAAIEIRKDYAAALVESRQAYADERAELEKNLVIAKDETQSKKNREQAMKNINAISPEYLGNITLETINTKEAKDAIDTYVTSLDKKAKAQAYNNLLVKEYEKLAELETQNGQELVGFWDSAGNIFKASMEELGKGNFGTFGAVDMETLNNAMDRNKKRGDVLKKQSMELSNEKIKQIKAMIAAETQLGDITVEESDAAAQIRLDNEAKVDAARKKAYDDEKNRLKSLEDAYKALYSKVAGYILEQENIAAQSEQDKLKLARDREAAQLALLRDAANNLAKNAEEQIRIWEKYYEGVELIDQLFITNITKNSEEFYKNKEKLREENLKAEKDAADKAFDINKAAADKEFDYYMQSEQMKAKGSLKLQMEALELQKLNRLATVKQGSEEEAALELEFAERSKQLKIDHATQVMNAIAGVASQVVDLISQVFEEANERRMAKVQEQYDGEKEQFDNDLANRVITREEYDAKMTRLDQAKEEKEKQAKMRAFKQQKALSLVTAIITGAQATLAAFSSGASYPFIGPATGAVFAGIAAALSAVQIGVIASQQFKAARGGVVPGMGSGSFDSVNALLAPGETVINSQSSSMFPNLLSEINQAGGGVSLAPTIPQTNVLAADNQSGGSNQNITYAVISEQAVTTTQSDVARLKRKQRFFTN